MARKQTLANHLVSTVGYRKGIRVVAFMAGWGTFIEQHGRPPRNLEEFAVLAGGSTSLAYRERDMFREAFPGQDDPTELWQRLRDGAQEKKDRRVLALQLGSVQLP